MVDSPHQNALGTKMLRIGGDQLAVMQKEESVVTQSAHSALNKPQQLSHCNQK